MINPEIPRRPILMLNDDILLELLRLVVYSSWPERIESYTDILSVSQVCSSWRCLVVEASYLWSSIDLNVLSGKSQMWREEVMRRSKQSPLSLSGRLYHLDNPEFQEIRTFFLSVLRQQWTRMQQVDLIISESILQALDFSELFNQPAPILTCFHIHISSDWDRPEFTPRPILLSSYWAPQALTSFKSNMFYLGVEDCSFFTHLTNLSLSCPQYTAHELLKLLANSPSLIDLLLEYHQTPSIITLPLPRVTPPSLKSISIMVYHGSFVPLMHLLDHVHLLQPLSLELCCLPDHIGDLIPLDPSDLRICQRVLRTFTTNALGKQAHDPLSTIMKVSGHRFEVSTHRNVEPDGRPCAFKVSLEFFSANELTDTRIVSVLQLLESCDFSGIRELCLSGTRLFATSNQWIRFFQMFSLLEKLEILDISILRPFENLNLFNVFPNLRGLVLLWIPRREESSIIFSVVENWTPRTSTTLHLPYVDAEDINRNPDSLMYLDKAVGLRVTWNEENGEYICGTGNSQILNFSQRAVLRHFRLGEGTNS